MRQPPPGSTLFPYTTLFRSSRRTCRKPWTGCGSLRAPPLAARSQAAVGLRRESTGGRGPRTPSAVGFTDQGFCVLVSRSEEHTSELQSQFHLVCRLLLEKKK